MTSTQVDFQSKTPPENYALAFEPFLYNQEGYLRLKNGECHSFYAVDHSRQQILARIHFLLVSDETGRLSAVSLPQSPFGSVEYGMSIVPSTLLDFICFAVDALRTQGVQVVEIRDCIPAYRPAGSGGIGLHSILEDVGFRKREVMVNHHIVVDQPDFANKIHPMEVRRLRKCQRAGFIARRESLSDIQFFYSFILNCRQERGWQLSMSRKEIQQVITDLPASYKVFSVYDQQTCVAASLVVQVDTATFYNFFPAARLSYNPYSPMVMLLAELYQFCYVQKIKLLDLGTSSHQSLQRFKSHMGGVSSEKITLVLDCLPNVNSSHRV